MPHPAWSHWQIRLIPGSPAASAHRLPPPCCCCCCSLHIFIWKNWFYFTSTLAVTHQKWFLIRVFIPAWGNEITSIWADTYFCCLIPISPHLWCTQGTKFIGTNQKALWELFSCHRLAQKHLTKTTKSNTALLFLHVLSFLFLFPSLEIKTLESERE